MRIVGRKACKFLWVLCFAWGASFIVMAAMPYFSAGAAVFSTSEHISSGQMRSGAITIPSEIIDAYKAYRLPVEAERRFEAGLRSGAIVPPPNTTVVLHPKYPDIFGTLTSLLLLVGMPCLIVALLQYLIVGFSNPIRLLQEGQAGTSASM